MGKGHYITIEAIWMERSAGQPCAVKGAVKPMCKKNNSSLFFVCSLIEQIGRTLHQKRGKVVSCLGIDRIRILLKNADILHCEPIAKVADDVVAEFGLQQDDYDNVGQSKYLIPDVWTIGKYSLQGTTQGRYLTGGVPPVRFSM